MTLRYQQEGLSLKRESVGTPGPCFQATQQMLITSLTGLLTSSAVQEDTSTQTVVALREFRIRDSDYHEHGIIRPYWCPGNYNVADFFSKLLRGVYSLCGMLIDLVCQ